MGRFWELLFGGLLSFIFSQKQQIFNSLLNYTHFNYLDAILTFNIKKFKPILTCLGLIMLGISVNYISKKDLFPYYNALMPIFGTCMVIAGGSNNIFSTLLLENKFSRFIACISYPLYLWHWPIISFLYIINDTTPNRIQRILAVVFSGILAWLTYKFVEIPMRFKAKTQSKLLISMLAVGLTGFLISKIDFTHSNNTSTVIFRKGLEHRIGSSSRWFEGKENWLFLGNSFHQTVAKLKLSKTPEPNDLESWTSQIEDINAVAKSNNTHIVLVVAPNKSTIYNEYLPKSLHISEKRYVDYYLNPIMSLSNTLIYDSTYVLKAAKKSSGNLYFKTDSHWNQKGSFVAYEGLMNQLGFNHLRARFSEGKEYYGDLISISQLRNFPVENDDSWDVELDVTPVLSEHHFDNINSNTSFGSCLTIKNQNPIVDKVVWVVGDSFTKQLRPYLNATFREIKYVGHWDRNLKTLAADLKHSKTKPDLIIIIKAERTF